MDTMNTKQPALLLVLALAFAASCSHEAHSSSAPASDVPESFFLASPPAARTVADVITSAKDGDEVVVIGRVGGARKVFVDGFAAFSIVDATVQPCGSAKMDECQTPWDYCCDAPEVMAKNTVSVELMLDGKPLKATARSFHGLDHLKTVVVTGKVVRDDAGNVRVLATGLHVQA
jgi:hypothetical protein